MTRMLKSSALLALLTISALVMTGCQQRSGTAMPDRGNRSVSLGPESSGSSSSARGSSTPAAAIGQPGAGEEYYTFKSDDKLYLIAQDRGVALYSLIERNDLSAQPRAGQQIVVPRK